MRSPPPTVAQTTSPARRLVAELADAGHWRGRLSSSALSTATAVCALQIALDRGFRAEGVPVAPSAAGGTPPRGAPSGAFEKNEAALAAAVAAGAAWLCDHQNDDGGWGDTTDSPSNLSTTTLAWAALGLAEGRRRAPATIDAVLERAEGWLRTEVGELTPARLAAAITASYGEDRTFSAPILTLCALCGRLGDGRDGWRHVFQPPFELAALPRAWFRFVGLGMVSYALPALIAIGHVRHHHRPSRNPFARAVRAMARRPTLRTLAAIQPDNGGFLEATPLTSFVTMSVVASGHVEHVVVRRGVGFLLASMRADGGWPIDTDLATWVTTLSINALAAGGRLTELMPPPARVSAGRWLLRQQGREVHPYTGAAPGAWAWTELPGGVPDADDTAGALLALRELSVAGGVDPEEAFAAATDGIDWLLALQNRDGGIPTFCRGWGKLPFDRSGPDLTAHALRAIRVWTSPHPAERAGSRSRTVPEPRVARAVDRAIRYLVESQRSDGVWVPLWFGNQQAAAMGNPVYGTAAVLRAARVRARDAALQGAWQVALDRGRGWLLAAANPDGGWGGDAGVPSTIEETALAVTALRVAATDGAAANVADHAAGDGDNAAATGRGAADNVGAGSRAADRGVAWLETATDGWSRYPASPVGLYFAKLWYSEKLYPLIFAAAALESGREQ